SPLSLHLPCRLYGLKDREQVFFDSKTSENRRLLREITEPGPGSHENRQPGYRLAPHHDLAAVRFAQTYHHIERSGRAGSVGSKQTGNLSCLKVDINAINNQPAAEGFLQAPGTKSAMAFLSYHQNPCPVDK